MALEKVLLAKPRGFCAGVVRAVDIVNIALDVYEKPLYVRKEIVHNRHVVEELRAKGTVFVDTLLEVPSGATVVFSAHGVSPEVREKAKAKNLKVIDATCPLVTKVHLEAVKYAREGYTIVLIGHKGHEEVVGTMGEAPQHMVLISSREEVGQLQPPDPNRIAYLTQTTLSLDETREIIAALRERFPEHRRSTVRRHLLCHSEPPGISSSHGATRRPHSRCRLCQQFELQPVGGGSPKVGFAVLPDR